MGVACPIVSACYAVASYATNGPNLTLAEQWNRTGTSAQAATGQPVAPGALPPRASVPVCRAHRPSAAAAQPWHGPGSGPAASLAGPAHRRQPAVSGAVPGSAYRPRGRGGSLRANDARVTPPVRRDPGRRPGLSPGGTLTGPAGTIAPEGHDRACHAGGPGRPLPKGGGSPRRDTQRYEARRAEEKGKPMPSAGHKEGPKNSSPVTGPDRPGRPTGR